MTGTLIDAAAILLGGLAGAFIHRQPSEARQLQLKSILGLVTIAFGFIVMVRSFGGSFLQVMGQILIMFAAMISGKFIGEKLHLQDRLNRFGLYAKAQFSKSTGSVSSENGFLTCTILFCLSPITLIGPQESLSGGFEPFQILVIKAAMDGMTALALAPTYGRGVIGAILPLTAIQGTIALGALAAEPQLFQLGLIDSITAVTGLFTIYISMVILDARKLPLADFLPSFVIAPLLTWIF